MERAKSTGVFFILPGPESCSGCFLSPGVYRFHLYRCLWLLRFVSLHWSGESTCVHLNQLSLFTFFMFPIQTLTAVSFGLFLANHLYQQIARSCFRMYIRIPTCVRSPTPFRDQLWGVLLRWEAGACTKMFPHLASLILTQEVVIN